MKYVRQSARIKLLTFFTFLLTTSFLLPIFSQTKPVMAAKCAEINTFFDWGCTDNKDAAISDVLLTILNWLAAGVGVAVTGGIIYGAITIASAADDPNKKKSGIIIIKNSVTALVLYFAMYAILNFLTPGGLFT